MCWSEIFTNLSINLFAGILIFLLGIFWPVIPKSYKKFILKRFWGKSVFDNDFIISYGALLDSRLFQPNPPPFRYVKQYHDGRTVQIVGPWGNIVGDCEIRSSSYIINSISTYRKCAITVLNDSLGYTDLNRTFIALGSASSNEMTDLILREPNNKYFIFGQDAKGETYIEDVNSKKQFRGFQPPVKKDIGLVLKIENTRFNGHYFFVCAGLGEWGTSGASWYLSNKWQELKDLSEFGIIVEVNIGSDNSAKKIFQN
jgi:hypothetical protein